MHHLIVETLLIVGCTHDSSGVYAYMCWVAAQVQGENIMHCWHYGGCTKGDHGSWSEYSCNMSLSLSWSFMVSGGLWFFFADLVHIQGEHNPLPLMSKGENVAEVFEVAIKSKGGDCWHYVSGMVICYRCCT
jgi:hypothetical protein